MSNECGEEDTSTADNSNYFSKEVYPKCSKHLGHSDKIPSCDVPKRGEYSDRTVAPYPGVRLLMMESNKEHSDDNNIVHM